MAWAEVYFCTKWRLHSSSIQPFGYNRHGPKIRWRWVCPFFWGYLGPHRTQSRLGRGLPPYQVASQSIQPLGHNGHWPKIGGCALFFFWEGLGPHLKHNVAWAEAYLHIKWHLGASSHLATIEIGRKLVGALSPFLGGELGPI